MWHDVHHVYAEIIVAMYVWCHNESLQLFNFITSVILASERVCVCACRCGLGFFFNDIPPTSPRRYRCYMVSYFYGPECIRECGGQLPLTFQGVITQRTYYQFDCWLDKRQKVICHKNRENKRNSLLIAPVIKHNTHISHLWPKAEYFNGL